MYTFHDCVQKNWSFHPKKNHIPSSQMHYLNNWNIWPTNIKGYVDVVLFGQVILHMTLKDDALSSATLMKNYGEPQMMGNDKPLGKRDTMVFDVNNLKIVVQIPIKLSIFVLSGELLLNIHSLTVVRKCCQHTRWCCSTVLLLYVVCSL